MPRQNAYLAALNRGIISADALGRVDVEVTALAAETMDNWLPKTLGPMRLRTGLQYLGATASNNAAQVIDFIAGTTDTAILELTANVMRIWVADALVTRASVSTTIATLTSATGWTDASTNGATLTHDGSGLTLNTTNAGGIAKVTRTITVAGGDQNVEHGIKIVIPVGYGYVYLRVGSAAGGDEYVEETRLLAGQHHLAFTPTGDFHLTIWAKDRYAVTKRVTSIAVEGAGVVSIVTPWGASDLNNLQWDQSADVVFVACDGIKQTRIERRAAHSWSVVDYRANDGPFVGQTSEIKLKPAAATGRTTLTANQAFFDANHVGSLFRLFHNGHSFRHDVGGEEVFTDPIRVAGEINTNYSERDFSITTAGTWSGTLNVERSIISSEDNFAEYPRDASAGSTADITTNTTYNNEDEDPGIIAWYRVGFQSGNYTSGTAQVTLTYVAGGDYGLARVVAFTSTTVVDVEVLRLFRKLTYTNLWSEGAWSAQQTFPTCTTLHKGRLWWFSGSQIWGSVSDDYESFDQENLADDGPIIRTIGQGPVDKVNFAASLGDLVFGTAAGEWVARASGGILTPADFELVPISTFGSKDNFRVARIDEAALMVHRSGMRLLEIAPGQTRSGYSTSDITVAVPDLLTAGVVSIAVQRFPDTRIHCVLADGTVAILTYDNAENLRSWVTLSTGTTGAPGAVERVVVLSQANEDAVYYVVKRTIGGSPVRFLEKFSLESACIGGTLNKQLDSFIVQSGSPTTTVSGLTHLEGEAVAVWADGNVVEESDGSDGFQAKLFTVASGAITLDDAASDVVVGLPYTAQFKSTKLAYAAAGGTAVNQRKRAVELGLVLGTSHHRGLRAGRDFTTMNNLPQVADGAAVATGTIFSSYDEPMVPFEGDWNTDSRLCLEGNAPYPVTVKAVSIGVQTSG